MVSGWILAEMSSIALYLGGHGWRWVIIRWGWVISGWRWVVSEWRWVVSGLRWVVSGWRWVVFGWILAEMSVNEWYLGDMGGDW